MTHSRLGEFPVEVALSLRNCRKRWVSNPLPRPTLDDFPQPYAVARGNAKQLRPARNEIGFVFMQKTICEHDLPKRFDDALPSLLIKLAAEHAQEAIEISDSFSQASASPGQDSVLSHRCKRIIGGQGASHSTGKLSCSRGLSLSLGFQRSPLPRLPCPVLI